jgi:hypothetical protein
VLEMPQVQRDQPLVPSYAQQSLPLDPRVSTQVQFFQLRAARSQNLQGHLDGAV